MIVIIGTLSVEPSDRDALLEASRAVMAGTLQEAGCLHYSFTADIVDPGIVHVVERWESEDHLGPHMKSDHIREFGRALKPLGIEGRDFTVYEVASEHAL